ncbi:ABC transporter ATP-binding protein/permease [Gammaproteobacteria bacterium]|jgi:ATP-binding cassette, subfamily B, bacterial PglK|nr:ABC transporter ATP-binding protein/permease [Gammaproteobacteria bacterium]MDC0129011.1 ABC transporter ATP-binding protein/permease [Gammaproteobacteria bacterium]
MNIRVYKDHINKIFEIFGKSRSYLALLFLSFVSLAALDLLGISLIGPFVLIFFDFERIQSEWGLFIGYDQKQLALYASVAIVFIFALRSVCVWAVNAFILNVTFNRQVELRAELIVHILEQDYSARLAKSTAHYTTTIFAHCGQFVQSTLNIFRISAESLSVVFIMGLLIFTDFKLFLTAFLFCGLIISLMLFFVSSKFIKFGEDKNRGLVKFSNAVTESVYGIKEIKILGLADFFKSKVIEGASLAAAAEKRLYLFSIVPRYLVETMLVTVICIILIVANYNNENVSETIAVLSIFLVAALRLLPSMSLIIAASNALSLDVDSIKKLHNELSSKPQISKTDKSAEDIEKFVSFDQISFNNLSYHYEGEPNIFNGLDLKINNGDFIGLVGHSGEGKTTLIDLILGINIPQNGDITIDGKSIYENLESWRATVAYLPQEIFLVNGTIAENIALGRDIRDIDIAKVNKCIKKAGLAEVIDNLPEGLMTEIGERGLKFSGGQRQRIALARAFFSDRNIFLLDESTSALDKDSAERILNQISDLSQAGSTIILISHNEEMLSKCNRKLRISNGQISEI